MRATSLATTLVALALSLTSLAAPSPKKLSLQGIGSQSVNRVKQVAAFKKEAAANPKVVANAAKSTAAKNPTVKAPFENIWASLTSSEAAQAVAFLHKQKELNLTASADAGTWDNSIGVVDLVFPNKTDALDYLAGKGAAPDRYAKVIINHYATDEPYLAEYIVGPLSTSGKMTYELYNFGATKGVAKQRSYAADDDLLYDWVLDQVKEVGDVIKILTNNTWDSFDWWGIDPLWHENGRVINWYGAWSIPTNVFDGETLLPQGFYINFDCTGRDPSKWGVIGWLYNDVFYKTAKELRKAVHTPGFEIAELNEGPDETWFGSDRVGDEMPLDGKAPPMGVEPEGRRFKVDEGKKYVEWMDFSFYIGFTRDTGVRIFDVHYKGERIIYEIGLTEAVAHYAGNDPVQSGTAYLDTFYGFGPYAFEMLAGFDCPAYATFLNASFSAEEVTTTHRNSICLFEADGGYALQRHSSMNYVSATKNSVFTLRTVSTVGNYDYTFSYNFYLDGSIEFVVQASGYIQSAFYAKNDDYGYKIHKGLSGSMHDHSLNFKVDLDILGTENTLVKHSIVPVTEKYVWSNQTRSTMKLERSNITNEDEGKMDWPYNGKDMYMVANFDHINEFGEPRGYRVMPSRGGAGMRLTIQNSSNLFNSQGFATHQWYVTKQHDSEPSSSHSLNDYDTRTPIIDFSKFFDSENLVQEDLVLWMNLGMHHVPHTGDIPNTVMTTAQSAIIISPHNYLLNDPSRATKQQIRLDYNSSAEGIVSAVKTFGSTPATGEVNLTALAVDYWSYEGDVNVRKFPYDPLHPYNETESIV